MKKIGLSLGGGGAKGFARIPILEVFDALKNKDLGKMLQLVDPDLGIKSRGLLKGERFFGIPV